MSADMDGYVLRLRLSHQVSVLNPLKFLKFLLCYTEDEDVESVQNG